MTMVFCAACGSKISVAAIACPDCGQPNLMKPPQASPSSDLPASPVSAPPATRTPRARVQSVSSGGPPVAPTPATPNDENDLGGLPTGGSLQSSPAPPQFRAGENSNSSAVASAAAASQAARPVSKPMNVPAAPRMKMGEAIKSFFHNYTTFSGRARRSEFWFVQLFVSLVGLPLYLLTLIGFVPALVVQVIWALAIFIPDLALISRRLHDIDKSFWWSLMIFVPLAGPIVLLVFWLIDSKPGSNRFGNSPKYR